MELHKKGLYRLRFFYFCSETAVSETAVSEITPKKKRR